MGDIFIPPTGTSLNSFESKPQDVPLQNWAKLDVNDIFSLNRSVTEAMKNRETIMEMIYRMYESSMVSAAAKYRSSLIQMSKLAIYHDPNIEPGVALKRYTDTYFQPMGWKIREYFDMFGLCPVQWVSQKLYIGDDVILQELYRDKMKEFIHIEVPMPLPRRSFTIETYQEKGIKKDRVLTLSGEEVDTILYCDDREGPLLNNPGFDSDCGSLVEDWIRLVLVRKMNMELQRREVQPIVYIEKLRPTTNNAHDAANEQNDAIMDYIFDINGYPTPIPPEIRSAKGAMVIPRGYTVSTYQQKPNVILDEHVAQKQMIKLVASTFAIAMDMYTERGGMVATRESSYAVDMDRSRTTSVMQILISHVVKAMQQLWAIKFKQFGVYVHIPMRPQVDMKTMHQMKSDGILSDDFVRDESLNIIGVHHDHIKVLGDQMKISKFRGRKRLREVEKHMFHPPRMTVVAEEEEEEEEVKEKVKVESEKEDSDSEDSESEKEEPEKKKVKKKMKTIL